MRNERLLDQINQMSDLELAVNLAGFRGSPISNNGLRQELIAVERDENIPFGSAFGLVLFTNYAEDEDQNYEPRLDGLLRSGDAGKLLQNELVRFAKESKLPGVRLVGDPDHSKLFNDLFLGLYGVRQYGGHPGAWFDGFTKRRGKYNGVLTKISKAGIPEIDIVSDLYTRILDEIMASPNEGLDVSYKGWLCYRLTGFTDYEIRDGAAEAIDKSLPGFDEPPDSANLIVEKVATFVDADLSGMPLRNVSDEELYDAFLEFRETEERAHPHRRGVHQHLAEYWGLAYEKIERAYASGDSRRFHYHLGELIEKILKD